MLVFLLIVFFSCADYLYGQALSPLQQQHSEKPDNNTIGCIFPLSGRYELIGRKALKGALTATGFFQSSASKARIVARDSGSTAEDIQKALEEAITKDRASVVIGPVINPYINEISVSAKNLEIPTVVFPLSDQDTAQASSYYLMEFSYSLEKQSAVLAKYAAGDINIISFGILYPRTRFGELFRDAFTKSVRESGKDVVYLGSYDPKLLDISEEIRWIRARNPDALFIPDNSTESAELIMRLRQEGSMKNLIFLGPNTWNSNTFLKAVGGENGIILTDFFFQGDDRWTDFRNKYLSTFDGEPGFIEYQIYEAVSLVLSVLDFRIENRSEVIERLLAFQDNPNFDIARNPGGGLKISPKPFILMVKDGSLVRVK